MQTTHSNPGTNASTRSACEAADSKLTREQLWNARYEILRSLHERGESVNVFQQTKIDDVPIGQWLSYQRSLHRLGKLGQERSEKLERIGVVWSPASHRDTWNAYYAVLVKLYQDGKNLDLPKSAVIDGLAIGRWLSGQRAKFRNNLISASSIKKLDAIGFPWGLRKDARWQANFAVLQKHHDAGKDVNDRPAKILNTEQFRNWYERQHEQYAAGKLSADRLQRLTDLGFIFGTCHDVAWERHFAVLKKRHLAGETVNLTKPTIVDGLNIGDWISNQRVARRAGKLSEERIGKLEKIGFTFASVKEEWERNIGILKQLHASGKDVNLPSDAVIDGVPIGQWIKRQRHKRHPTRTQSPERTALLESLGLKWSVRRGRPAGLNSGTTVATP